MNREKDNIRFAMIQKKFDHLVEIISNKSIKDSLAI